MTGVVTALSTVLTSSAFFETYASFAAFMCAMALVFLSIYVINKSLKSLKDDKVQM